MTETERKTNDAAVRTYQKAVELAIAGTDKLVAIDTLIREAANDAKILDLASFHCESVLAEESPGKHTLVSAFKLLRAAWEELDSRGHKKP